MGINKGIIVPNKLPFELFLKHERQFHEIFREYKINNTYEEWLIMNNFGIIYGIQEFLFDKKPITRGMVDKKRRFVRTVKQGDIIITGKGEGGFLGHVAIMKTDHYVLDMPGGKGFAKGIKDNNRQLSKYKWFDKQAKNWIWVYRCPDDKIVRASALWADFNYWNPIGGLDKKKHITYKIDRKILSKEPSYCTKVIIQAYYYGSGSKMAIRSLKNVGIVTPSAVPRYFQDPYKLNYIGKF